MHLYWIWDIIIVCVAAGVIWRAWRTGLVSAAIRLLGALAAYAGAWIVSGPLSVYLYTNFAHERLVRYAEGLIPAELTKLTDALQLAGGADTLSALGIKIQDVTVMVSGALAEKLREFGLDNLPFDLIDTDKAGGEIAGKVLEQGITPAEAITTALLQPLATTALRVVGFVVVFGLLLMVVNLLYRVGFGVNKLPLVGGLNRLLGVGVGVVEALVVVYILCMVLAIVSALFGAKVEWLNWNELQKTKIFSAVVGFRPPAGLGIL